MRKLAFLLSATLAASAVFASVGHAADMDMTGGQGGGGFYGNLHGTLGTDMPSNASRLLPYYNIGAKLAYEGGVGEWGAQADLDYWNADYSWAVPTVSTLSGYNTQLDTALHLTYLIDQDRKLGLFGGYSYFNSYAADPTGGLAGGLVKMSSITGLAGIGAEGLMDMNNETSFQVRAAAMTRIVTDAMVDTGLGPVRSGSTGLNLSDIGFMAGLGVNHQFTANWSARGDLGLLDMTYGSTGSNLLAYGGNVGLQYTFDSLPIAVGAQAGYVNEQVGSTSAGNYTFGTKLTYSFGGPSQGAEGKLFRSGMLGFLY